MRFLITLCAGLLASEIALSQIYIEGTFFPVYVNKNDAQRDIGGSTTISVPTESGFGYDFRTTLGYTFSNGIIAALTYNMYSISTSRPYTTDLEGAERSESKSELGPTVGYSLSSWRFLLTYFLSAKKELALKYVGPGNDTVSLDQTWTNSDGSGFQFAISYIFASGHGLEIGPSLIYRTVTYTKQAMDSRVGADPSFPATSMVAKGVDEELKPMITLVYRH